MSKQKLAQVNYWIHCMPGQQVENATMGTHGGILIGGWAVVVPSFKTDDLLQALRETWVEPLARVEELGTITAAQSMRLDSLRQLRRIVKILNKRELAPGVVHQVSEDLEGGCLTLMHNVQVVVPL